MVKIKTEPQKKTGRTKKPLQFTCVPLKQGKTTLYAFAAKASELYNALSINRRTDDKDEGYQRTLSRARVQAISQHIISEKVIPGSIVVSFDKATFDKSSSQLIVPKGTDVGWVIDGQHRLAGAHEAAQKGVDIELAATAFIGISENEQIEEFVTINREAKGVPTSLYLDLLGKLSNKKPSEHARERSADIANALRRDADSPFYEKIVVVTAPKDGQVSLTNFARKVAPLVLTDKGVLSYFSLIEQKSVISNYYAGLRNVFPTEYKKSNCVFFKTIGFGGLWNAFPQFFQTCLSTHGGFTVKDATAVFKKIEGFDFSAWRDYGTGNQAEILAGEDLKATLNQAFSDTSATGGTLKV